MHISTIVFFALLAFFTWRGYQKGFIGSITRVLGWIAAYPAAIVFTKPVAKLITQYTSLDGLLVYFIAGSAIFLLVSLLVSWLLNLFSTLIPATQATQIGSKIGGASVGIFMGVLVGLLVVYAIDLIPKTQLLQAKPLQQTQLPDEQLPEKQQQNTSVAKNSYDVKYTPALGVPQVRDLTQSNDSFIEASAKKLMGKAAATAMDLTVDDKTTTQITKAFVENPQTMLTHVQQVTNNGQIKNLMADEKIQSMLTRGDTNALLRDPGFQELMNNPSVQALMAQSEVKSEAGAQAAAEKLGQAWSRVQTIKQDPRVIAIISDPEFQQQLNAGNKLPLMMNPKLNQLAEIIFSSETPPENGISKYQIQDINETTTGSNSAPAINNSGAEDTTPATTIYRWTDENGQVHYSDKPVKEK